MRNLIRQKIADSLQRPISSFTRRDVRVPLVPGKVIAVIGMRRTGKTTFLWQLLADRLACGARREDLLYFAFEDERLSGLRAPDLDVIRDEYERARGPRAVDGPPTWFLDEVQVVEGGETFVRRMHDELGVELFVSGSSARLLSREVATSLRGRGMEAAVYPFSFREYLRHLGMEPAAPVNALGSSDRSRLQGALRAYLATGGFPEAQGLEARDRHALLSGYVDAVLLRDIVERHQVSNPVALRWMVRHLLANPAGTFSIRSSMQT